MKFTNATNFHRKSGVAQWRDLQCAPRSSQILLYKAQPENSVLREYLLLTTEISSFRNNMFATVVRSFAQQSNGPGNPRPGP